MVFSSLEFICVFLVAVFLLYSVLPSLKVRNALLIVASLGFYAYGEPVYVLLMVFSSLVNYLCALWVARYAEQKNRFALVVAIVINLGILVLFKYSGMLVSTCNAIFGLALPVPEIALPIGISFFTFQALSYVIDVYRGVVDVQRNYFYVLLYISFFPQLIAGPIVKYRDIQEMITERQQTIENIANGFRRFVCGLAKKVIIANTMGQVADLMFSTPTGELSFLAAWIGAIAYLFQIYYDFSGYSDMALGLGLMFGFRFKENFNYPYSAKNVQDFWRRWHISLSTWFKEYLYIPLGGNRKGKHRAVANRLTVFVLCGLWHGASWTFVVWGLWHGMFLLIEEYVPWIKKLPAVFGRIYTLLVVTVGFVMFRADTLTYGLEFLGRMFFGFDFSDPAMSLVVSQLTPWFIFVLVIAIIGCGPIQPIAAKVRHALYEVSELSPTGKALSYALYAAALLGLIWCICILSSSGYNPFIYFRF